MPSLRNMLLLPIKSGDPIVRRPEYAAVVHCVQAISRITPDPPRRPRCAAYAARKQQVFPRLCLVGRGAQQVCRMIGHDQRRASIAMHAIAQARDRSVDVEQPACGALAERDDQAWRDQFDLPVEIRSAGLRFERLGRAVVRRTAFQDVGDVDVPGAIEFERHQHVVEQLPSRADERFTLRILVRARRLADEHPLRVGAANAGHRIASRLAQRAGRAHGDIARPSRRNPASRSARAAHRHPRVDQSLDGNGRDPAGRSCIRCFAHRMRRAPQAPHRSKAELAQDVTAVDHGAGVRGSIVSAQRMTSASSRPTPGFEGG